MPAASCGHHHGHGHGHGHDEDGQHAVDPETQDAPCHGHGHGPCDGQDAIDLPDGMHAARQEPGPLCGLVAAWGIAPFTSCRVQPAAVAWLPDPWGRHAHGPPLYLRLLTLLI